MNLRITLSWKSLGLPLSGLLMLVAMVLLVIENRTSSTSSPALSPTTARTYPGLDLKDPAATFETLRYVVDTGGDEHTRAQAIVWLDQQSRTMQPLSPRLEAWMFEVLNSGGHPQWDKEYKFWLFNSAFNALHPGPQQEKLTKLLAQLAVNDPEKTMRLYALQHLEVQRMAGRLTEPLVEEVRAMLLQIAATPDGQEAGLAIRLLAQWDGASSAMNPDVASQAIKLAADTSRALDGRVTALYAAGPAALALARDLASDATQPVLLRKASIALIGAHGSESDLTQLQKLSAESSRLAQAAEPALQTLRHRSANPHAPALIPF
jgi:hypothetical protein